MRSDVLELMKEQLESVKVEIKSCEIEMLDCIDDAEATEMLSRIKTKYEAVAAELETAIQKLR